MRVVPGDAGNGRNKRNFLTCQGEGKGMEGGGGGGDGEGGGEGGEEGRRGA